MTILKIMYKIVLITSAASYQFKMIKKCKKKKILVKRFWDISDFWEKRHVMTIYHIGIISWYHPAQIGISVFTLYYRLLSL